MSNFVDPGRAKRLIERDEKAARANLRHAAENRIRVSPEAAAVILAADRVADVEYRHLHAWNNQTGHYEPSPELQRLYESVAALRKKRAEELARP